VYARAIGTKTYAFAHGTHFRRELVSEWQKGFLKAFDVLQLDRLLERELKKSGDLDQVESMEELERMVTPFVDSLWPSSKNIPTSRSDELWYMLTLLREGSGQGRETPSASTIFSRQTALPEDVEGRINLLTDGGEPTDGSLSRFREHFLPCLVPHLEYQEGLLQNDLTFVYGDTHRGGWGTLAPSEAWSKPIDVYNCGAWVVDGPDHHPACHLFAVDEDGKEHLLDLSFGDVKVGDDTLLGLAAKDAEHRLKVVNRGVRAFGATLQLMESSYGTGFRFLNNLF
jgi:hypothetical protein